MAYIPNEWKPRKGSGLNRFQDQNGKYYEFTAAPAEITQAGTPFSADWMNHIEQELGSEGKPDGLATLGTDGLLEASQVPKQYPNGIWFTENGSTEFPGLSYNGAALWLGGNALSGPHHTGATTISAGGEGTAYIAVYGSEGSGTSYPIFHKGNTFKILWSGTWNSGTITVPGIQDYSQFRIGMDGQGTVITAYRWGTHLRGIGGYVSAAGNKLAYLFTATLSGDTLTWVNCVDIYLNNSSTVDSLIVTSITGIL